MKASLEALEAAKSHSKFIGKTTIKGEYHEVISCEIIDARLHAWNLGNRQCRFSGSFYLHDQGRQDHGRCPCRKFKVGQVHECKC